MQEIYAWDVVEPWAYFISLGYTVLGFLFFAWSGSEPEYSGIKEYWTRRTYNKHARKLAFDSDKYARLKDAVQRYQTQLHAIRLAQRVRI